MVVSNKLKRGGDIFLCSILHHTRLSAMGPAPGLAYQLLILYENY